MRTKILEVRDRATYIAVLAVEMIPQFDGSQETVNEGYHLRRAGYHFRAARPRASVLLTPLAGGRNAECDPYAWPDRTLRAAHAYIAEHFERLRSGDVVDVEFILGEATAPKASERLG